MRLLLSSFLIALSTWTGCANEITGPKPTLAEVEPPVVCNDQVNTEVTLTGTELSPLPVGTLSDDPQAVLPEVALTRAIDIDGGAVAGEPIVVPDAPHDPDKSHVRWQAQESLSFDVFPELGLETGLYGITATNANSNTAKLPESLLAVPPPTLTTMAPDILCGEQANTLTLTGDFFIRWRGLEPTVAFRENGTLVAPLGVTTMSGCRTLPGTSGAEACDTLIVAVPPRVVATGEHLVTVENPAPAGCRSNETARIFVAGAPIISTLEPSAICNSNQPATLVATGTGFLKVDDGGLVEPTVTLNGSPITVTWDACNNWSSTDHSGELCTGFTIPVPGPGFAEGTYTVEVTNPAPADCTATIQFGVAPAPTITGVDPIKVCGEGDTFSVTGTGFVPGSLIELDDGGPVYQAMSTFVDANNLDGFIQGVPEGDYDIWVQNGSGCEAAPLVDALRVVDDPDLFFVDPPNVYNGVDMRITVWVAGIEGTDPQVLVRPAGTSDDPILLAAPQFDGTNKVQATAAASLLAPGDYDIIIQDLCEAELAGVLHVTEDLTVSVAGIAPEFGVSGIDPLADPSLDNTGVAVFSDTDNTTLAHFVKTPRIYLNPVKSTNPATEMKAVQWINDAGQVNGIVPATFSTGEYQVIVINPDGGVGISPVNFRVLPNDDPPPRVTFLDPGQVEANPGQSVTIVGDHFPTDLANLEVSATCIDPGNAAKPTVTIPDTMGSVTVDSLSATSIQTTWDTSTLSEYACVVRVDNLLNATFVEFSAISITESSGNLPQFTDSGRNLVVARQALSGAAMRMNATSRYVFAIGGDDAGSPAVRFDTVESAPVSPFGEIEDDFTIQRNTLPEGRALISGAAAVVGRYVYIAGGRVGADPGTVDATVLRAYLLDPFEAPVIEDLDFVIDEDNGIGPGVWYYRVAPLLDGNDPNNPNGEGLPSEPLVIQVPVVTAATGAGVDVELRWLGIPNATAYRIYRTTAADQALGDEVYLAEVSHTGGPTAVQSFVDDGTIDNSMETATPMPLGSLGTWHAVATLTTEREGAAIVAVPDRHDSTRHFLYVLGGRDSAGSYVGAIEWTGVQATASNDQTLVDPVDGTTADPFAVSGRSMAIPVWLLGAVFMDDLTSTAVPTGSSYLYALPGIDDRGGGSAIDSMEAFAIDVGDGTDDGDGVDGDGSLSVGEAMSQNPSTRYSGYGYVANHNFIHLMGGKTAAPSVTGDETYLTTAPQVHNWDAGTNLSAPRHMMGTAYESAFVFIIGGVNGGALSSVEQSSF